MNKDVAKIIGDIANISTLINLQGKFQVFLNISGHVGKFEISVYEGEWESFKIPYISQNDVYFDDRCSVKKLRSIRDKLYKIYKNGRLNLEQVGCSIEKVKHYNFY